MPSPVVLSKKGDAAGLAGPVGFSRNQLLLWGGALAWLAVCLVGAFRHPFAPGANTFSAFYYASLAVRNGGSILEASTDYIYPPFMAFMIQPFTYVDISVAYRLWLCFSLLLTSSSMYVGIRAFSRCLGLEPHLRFGLTAVAMALLLSAGEAKTEWSVAQCDGLVLDAFAFSFALMRNSPIMAGLVIAAGANIKYQTLVLVPYLLWRRRFKAVAATGVGMAVFGVLPAVSMGWRGTMDSWASALGGLGKMIGLHTQRVADIHALDWGSSVSIPSAIARFARDGHWPSWGMPLLLALCLGALAVLTVTIYLRHGLPLWGALDANRTDHRSLFAMEWCMVMAGLLALGPQTTRRHLFLLMLFHLFIAVWLFTPGALVRGRNWVITALVVFQLALRLPPSAKWCQAASDAWKYIGGPSWFLLALAFIMLDTLARNWPRKDTAC